MLTAKKKISVREPIQESTFSTKWFEFQNFVRDNSKIISWISIGAIAVVVFGYIYFTNKKSENIQASVELAKVLPLYEQQQYKLAIEGDPATRTPGLKNVVSSFSGTNSADIANLYLGNCYLYTGQYDNAIVAYESSNPDGDILKSGVLAGLGAAYEAKKDYKKAAEYFEKAALKFRDDQISSDRLVQAGRNYSLSGDKAKAKELYEIVKNEYKSPRYSREMDRLIAELGIE